MPDVDLDAIREADEADPMLIEHDLIGRGEREHLRLLGRACWHRHDLLALLAEREVRVAELERLLHVRGKDVEYALGERDHLRAAAQAVGNDMDDVDFYGDPQKWPPVLNIGREPLAALAAAPEGRDAK